MSDIQTERKIVFGTLPVGLLQCNCTIVADNESGNAIVVDPGGSVEQIMAAVKQMDKKVVAIYCTHGHYDHITGAGELKDLTDAPIYLNEKDNFLWEGLEMQCQMFGVPFVEIPKVDNWIEEGDKLPIANGQALHTPGHSPGSMSFYFPDDEVVIVGDLLFRYSIGRTDLWGGSFKELSKSVNEKIFTLPKETFVITGHGPETKVIEEKHNNPFL